MGSISQTTGRQANREAVKDAIDTGALSGGVMPRDLFDEWVEEAQEASELLSQIRVVDMPREKMSIPKIGVGERQLRRQNEGEEVEDSSASTGSIDLDAEKDSLYWHLTSESVEDTIEGTAETVFNQMNTQFSADVQDLGINGDEDYADGDDPGSNDERFRNLNDGWLKIARDRGAPEVDMGDAELDTSAFNSALLTIEDKYLRQINGTQPLFVMSRTNHQGYLNHIGSERTTALGDAVLTGGEVTPFGYPIMSVSNMADDVAMLTSPRNLVYGLYREVEVEVLQQSDEIFDKDLFAKYAIRVRHDFQVEEAQAAVLIENIAAPTPEDPAE